LRMARRLRAVRPSSTGALTVTRLLERSFGVALTNPHSKRYWTGQYQNGYRTVQY
jgi:hypothetical protein